MCVLDVESRLSPAAKALLGARDLPALSRAMLLEISAVSLLRFTTTDSGLADIELVSSGAPASVPEMSIVIERGLTALGDEGSARRLVVRPVRWARLSRVCPPPSRRREFDPLLRNGQVDVAATAAAFL